MRASFATNSSHSQVWDVMKRALELYATLVNKRGEQHYAPVYPLFFQLAKRMHLR
jgi:hypothetical protein